MRLALHLGAVVVALLLAPPSPANASEIPLARISLGELGGWIEVPVSIKGRSGRWLIDTGASRNLVSPSFARTLGVTPRGSARAETALGAIEAGEVELPTLTLGTTERSRQRALVVDLALLFGAAAEGIDGVLGVPLLQEFQLELDLRAWKSNWREHVDAACPAGLVGVDIKRHRTLPVITIAAGTAGTQESYILDTGNPAGLIRIQTEEPDAFTPGLALPGDARLTVLPKAVIGPQARTAVPVVRMTALTLKKSLGNAVRGLAGTALLDGARWQLDLAGNRLCTEPGDIATPGGFGFTLKHSGNVLELDQVLPNGPAERAGLRSGDTVTRWQGGGSARPLAELWTAVHGHDTVTLEVGHPSQLVTLRRAIFAPLEPP